jgi:hypothetical protein
MLLRDISSLAILELPFLLANHLPVVLLMVRPGVLFRLKAIHNADRIIVRWPHT